MAARPRRIMRFSPVSVASRPAPPSFKPLTPTLETLRTHVAARIPAVADALSGPIEYRLYAWGATASTGNTHINAASLTAKFVAVPTLEFNFSGVQNQAPLTALKRRMQTSHSPPGSISAPASVQQPNNAGNEFNVAGFSTGTTHNPRSRQRLFDVHGPANLRHGDVSGQRQFHTVAARKRLGHRLCVFSSVGGFHRPAIGPDAYDDNRLGNQVILSGSFVSPQPTTDPVEFRLYGWNAATSRDNTHVNAASMRARFASVVGVPIDPTGSLTVQGDFYHLAGGQIAIDLGGHSAGVDYDTMNVLGKAELDGRRSQCGAGRCRRKPVCPARAIVSTFSRPPGRHRPIRPCDLAAVGVEPRLARRLSG